MNKTCTRCRLLLPDGYTGRPQCLECRRASGRERTRRYYKKNAEQIKAKHFIQYHTDIEKSRSNAREYGRENREAKRRIEARYRAKYPEKKRQKENKRRALKKAAQVGDVRYDRIFERDGPNCYLCLAKSLDKYHFDHIIALNLGGAHSEQNIAVACVPCNLSKKDKRLEDLPKEFLFRAQETLTRIAK